MEPAAPHDDAPRHGRRHGPVGTWPVSTALQIRCAFNELLSLPASIHLPSHTASAASAEGLAVWLHARGPALVTTWVVSRTKPIAAHGVGEKNTSKKANVQTLLGGDCDRP
jgi:hypothetical protein